MIHKKHPSFTKNKAIGNISLVFSGKWIILIINLFLFTSLFSQGKNEEVTIIAPYEPVISESNKINFKPSLDTLIVEKPGFTYNFQYKPYGFLFQPEPSKPQQFVDNRFDSINKATLRVGGGNYSTTLVDFFTNFKTGKKTFWNAQINHLASSGTIEGYGFPGSSSNRFLMGAKHDLDEQTLSGNVFYDRKVVHFYGYKTDEIPDSLLGRDDIKQTFRSYGANIRLKDNKASEDAYHYDGNFGFSSLSDAYEAHETQAIFDLNVRKNVDMSGKLKSSEIISDLTLQYFDFSDSIDNINSVMFNLKPRIRFVFDPLTVEAGLGITYTSDDVSKFYIHPLISAGLVIVPSTLKAYGELSGGISKNSFASLSAENPFVHSNLDYHYTNTRYQVKFGLMGNLSHLATYNVGASFGETDNLPFFVNSFDYTILNQLLKYMSNRFEIVYDNAEITTFFAEMNIKPIQGLSINGKFNFNKYNLTKELQPWHKPAVEILLDGLWDITGRISAGSQIWFIGKKYALYRDVTFTGTSEIMPVFDLGFNGKYAINKTTSVFLNINNITGSRYYMWYNYPSYRINIMAGLNFSL